MGIADVIPGVSGGTMALILGIYRPLIEAIRSVRLDLPVLFVRAASGGEARQAFLDALGEIQLRFIVPLLLGIVCAFIGGSMVIPDLMERYPAEMRGLFFGLILASVVAPLRLMERRRIADLVAAGALAVVFAVGGFYATDPAMKADQTSEWVAVEVPGTEPMLYKHVLRRGPAGKTSGEIFWDDQNRALQQAVAASDPTRYAELERLRTTTRAPATAKTALKRQAKLYGAVEVPAGTVVKVPRPSRHFIVLAGMIAICAMVLPGISGSFLLLVLGVYFFVLNAIKGSIHMLLQGELPIDPLTFLVLFGVGVVIGITVFSRVLGWLLARFPDPTMGALTGLMLGCLRGVWPWRVDSNNVWPTALTGSDGPALAAIAGGVVLVIGLQIADAGLRTRAAVEMDADREGSRERSGEKTDE